MESKYQGVIFYLFYLSYVNEGFDFISGMNHLDFLAFNSFL